jgi:hypothetical protein
MRAPDAPLSAKVPKKIGQWRAPGSRIEMFSRESHPFTIALAFAGGSARLKCDDP